MGLLILGLFGQPDVYLQQAREQWDSVLASPAVDRPSGLDDRPVARDDRPVARDDWPVARDDRPSGLNDRPVARDDWLAALADPAVGDRMARLQQQVARLESELTARLALSSPAPPPLPAASAPPELVPERTRPERPTGQLTAPQADALPPAVEIPERRDVPTQPTPPAPVPASVMAVAATPAPSASPSSALTPGALTPGAPAPNLLSPNPLAPNPLAPNPLAPSMLSPSIQTKAEPAKPGSSRSEPTAPDPPKPVPQKLAAARPAPAPPPLPQPASARPNIDDTKSVLARLRQQPAAPAASQQPEVQASGEAKPRPPASPSLPRLTAARAALASGRVEDARRLLQEVQLQLVFRPVDAAGEDPSSAGRGPADVARALEALSANDVALSRRYIDVTVNDLLGNATGAPTQQSDRRTPGYAPAYPPR